MSSNWSSFIDHHSFIFFFLIFFKFATLITFSISPFFKKNLDLNETKGNCWSSIQRNGLCFALLASQVTREECCSDGRMTTAFSLDNLSTGQLFFQRALKGGVKCQLCKNSCKDISCGLDKRCIVKRGRGPSCECDSYCTRQKRKTGKVCGTDGHTYRNACRLLKSKCKKDPFLSIAYLGPCQSSCEHIKCLGSKTCLVDQSLRPHCVHCLRECSSKLSRQEICGVDGITYFNFCELRRASCLKGKAIQVAYKGKCKINANCETITCPSEHKCLIDVLNSNKPQCVNCNSTCSLPFLKIHKKSIEIFESNPFCASNNVTYSNWCSMIQDSCKSGIILRQIKFGSCNESLNYLK